MIMLDKHIFHLKDCPTHGNIHSHPQPSQTISTHSFSQPSPVQASPSSLQELDGLCPQTWLDNVVTSLNNLVSHTSHLVHPMAITPSPTSIHASNRSRNQDTHSSTFSTLTCPVSCHQSSKHVQGLMCLYLLKPACSDYDTWWKTILRSHHRRQNTLNFQPIGHHLCARDGLIIIACHQRATHTSSLF
jgi:hypothetical protein